MPDTPDANENEVKLIQQTLIYEEESDDESETTKNTDRSNIVETQAYCLDENSGQWLPLTPAVS